jgi:CheY-like chemotaxis protein
MKSELNPTILLVEDNEDDVFAMQRALNIGKVTNPLQVVTDGKQAVDYLAGAGMYADRTQFPMPFLIFLDLKLPYLTGFEILRWMRTQPQLESIMVAVLTGSAEKRDQDTAYGLGARSYLVKPPKAETLNAILDSLRSFPG